uniref:Uncharacterized protein n=1 Tax=Glossina austeni TaxID=7395 RepID=A0A1A9UYU3_GLOAU
MLLIGPGSPAKNVTTRGDKCMLTVRVDEEKGKNRENVDYNKFKPRSSINKFNRFGFVNPQQQDNGTIDLFSVILTTVQIRLDEGADYIQIIVRYLEKHTNCKPPWPTLSIFVPQAH